MWCETALVRVALSVAAQEASNDTVERRNVTGKDLELFANLCSIFTTEG